MPSSMTVIPAGDPSPAEAAGKEGGLGSLRNMKTFQPAGDRGHAAAGVVYRSDTCRAAFGRLDVQTSAPDSARNGSDT